MAIGPKTTMVLKSYTETEDGMGGYTQVWAKVKNIVGVLATLSDRERMMYGKKAEGADYKFTVDYMFGGVITTMNRLYLGTRVFEIISREDPMNQQRFAVYLLSENVNG
jgi:head-tail adaptor